MIMGGGNRGLAGTLLSMSFLARCLFRTIQRGSFTPLKKLNDITHNAIKDWFYASSLILQTKGYGCHHL